MTSIWPQEIQCLIANKNYSNAYQYYEAALENDETCVGYYWRLGLLSLLQEREEEAQAAWMTPFMSDDINDIDELNSEFITFLFAAANEQENNNSFKESLLIRNYLRQLLPNDLDNSLKCLLSYLKFYEWCPEDLISWGVIPLVYNSRLTNLQQLILSEITDIILLWGFENDIVDDWIDACFSTNINSGVLAESIIKSAHELSYEINSHHVACHLLEKGLQYLPSNLDLLWLLPTFYMREQRYSKALSTANQYYQYANTLELRVLGRSKIISIILSGGMWSQEVEQLFSDQLFDIQALVELNPSYFTDDIALLLAESLIYFAYFKDRKSKEYQLHNHFIQICESNIRLRNQDRYLRYSERNQSKSKVDGSRKIRIGYLAKTLRFHSVGWLSRWLFKYHNRDQFEIYVYCIKYEIDELTEQYIKPYVDQLYSLGCSSCVSISDQIFEDNIDILVDLDSLTSVEAIHILSLRPAPIQTTWLGWDATGLSSVDYFIADNLVVSENAQDYYAGKIVKLPSTYVAVDGFEVGIPTLSRAKLNIPQDAVIYLSTQSGCKRHPNIVELHLKILNKVPYSYLLVKGLANSDTVYSYYSSIAEKLGVDISRLRFLEWDSDELTHRANLSIADVVLDTFPYNGATTSLEVLWSCIPLVTRVGNQFSARNSYAFLKNLGIEEGIAWNDEEYIEWGIRLGLDSELRDLVCWKLQKARLTSPLWNSKQFAHNMEQAYQEMWNVYIQGLK